MAEPLHRSSDIANFDTYPSGPELVDEPNRLLPEEAEASPLEQYGAQLGAAAGAAVVALRRAQQRVRRLASEKRATVTDIAAARVREVQKEATNRAEEWGQTIRERTFELRRQTRNGLYRARLRAREIQNDYPVQVVMGACILGILTGAGLRIWRANRA